MPQAAGPPVVSRPKATPKKGRRASDPHQQEIDAIMAARQQAIDLPEPEPYLPEPEPYLPEPEPYLPEPSPSPSPAP